MTTKEIKTQLIAERNRLNAAINALSDENTAENTTVQDVPSTSSNNNVTPGKRTLSAAARQAIAKAQKARWAKFHKAQRQAGNQ